MTKDEKWRDRPIRIGGPSMGDGEDFPISITVDCCNGNCGGACRWCKRFAQVRTAMYLKYGLTGQSSAEAVSEAAWRMRYDWKRE